MKVKVFGTKTQFSSWLQEWEGMSFSIWEKMDIFRKKEFVYLFNEDVLSHQI
jgi:hypothetical protein